jgi:hypothetical protein
MTTELTTTNNNAAIAERVMILGDLAQLTAPERVQYYGAVCKSIGLNPLTKPFDYITLNGKLTLYAKKDATDQLRKINGVSIGKPDIQQVDDLIIVTVVATDATGRTDSDIGVVKRSDMRGDVSNAMMKAITKAKRRVTLSICGLGFLDETEVETIPDAKPVIVADSGVIEPASNGKPQRTPAQIIASVELNRNDAAALRNLYKEAVDVAKMHGFTPADKPTGDTAADWIVSLMQTISTPAPEPAQ